MVSTANGSPDLSLEGAATAPKAPTATTPAHKASTPNASTTSTPSKPSLPRINVPSARSSPFVEVNATSPQPSVYTSNSNMGSPIERTIAEDNNKLPIVAIPILFKEAMLDTPSFRAHCEHMDKQIHEIEEWLQGLIARNTEIDAKLRPLRYAVNDLLEMFMPSFIYNNVLDQSNLSVVFEHYAEGISTHWTSVMFEARKHFAHIANVHKTYRNGQLSHYSDAREKWLQQQKLFDKATVEYYALGKKTNPDILRDSAQQVYKFRLRYLKHSLLFCETMIECQRRLNDILTDALTRPFKTDVPSFIPHDKRVEIGHIMNRMSAYARSQANSPNTSKGALQKLRSGLLDDAKKRVPSRLTTDYESAPDMWFEKPEQYCSDSDVSEKYGWMMLKIPQGHRNSRALWARVWVFVKDGTLGWLSLSQNKAFVQESPFVAVPLCYAQNARHEDRNFCFKITTPRVSFTLQAGNRAELKSWLSVLQAARKQFLGLHPSKYITAPSWTDDISCRFANKILELKGISTPSSDDTGVSQAISKRVDNCIEIIGGTFSFMDASRQFTNNHLQLAPDLLQTKPMATYRTLEALIASSFFPHRAVPNAIIGNYGGSVNWGLYSDALAKIKPVDESDPLNIGGSRNEYPCHYPEILKFHDMDMRSYFGPNMLDEVDEDLVVMAVRAVLHIKSGLYSSVTLYITGRTLYATSYDNGFYGLLTIPLSDLLVVQCNVGEEYDTVKLTYRQETTYQDIDLRFYIDPGTLFQRRLQFLFDNCKAKNPFKLERIITTLENIGREHHGDVLKVVSDDKEPSAKKENPARQADGSTSSFDTAGQDIMTFPENLKLHEENIDTQLEHQTDQHLKLVCEASFQISPKQLFYLIFGDTSPIYGDYVTDQNDLKWYYNNSAVEREYTVDLSKLMWFGYSDTRGIDVVQCLDRRDENYFYSVSELSGPCRLHTAQFRTRTKYIVALSKKSTRLLIYTSIEWLHETTKCAQIVLDRIVEETCKKRPLFLVENIHRHIGSLARNPNDPRLYDISRYGRVRITAARAEKAPRPVTDIDDGKPFSFMRFMLWRFMVVKWLGFLHGIKQFLQTVSRVISAHSVILTVACISLVLNIYFISYTGVDMWHNYFMMRSVERYADALHMSPEASMASRRAIYSKDVEQIVQHVRYFSEIADENNTCWQSFQRLALNNPHDHPDQFGQLGLDHGTQRLVENLLQKRLGIGMRRNELLSEYYMLERSEVELIRLEWKRWVLNEVKNCAEARQHAAVGEKLGIEHALVDYCVPCIEAARLLL